MQISEIEIKQFQKKILSWYKLNERDLPWRKTRDPYRILISEIMLQQTQVPRVIQKYNAWLERFPTLTSLARSTTADVLQYWSGLGYNRRAINLKRTAEIIANEYHGKFPDSEKELMLLPGIGKYTAHAVMCFAFNKQVSVVDINVKKVIIVEFMRKQHIEQQGIILHDAPQQNEKLDDALAWEIAEKLLPVGLAYEWNQALMDYSSSMLKKEKIHIPKQSKFVGSRRYYRGKILKLLLAQKSTQVLSIYTQLKDDYSENDQEIFDSIIAELEKEKFIVKKKKKISIAD